MVHASNLARKLIEGKLSEDHGGLSKLFLRFSAVDLEGLGKVNRYVASFCAAEDLLSQWRGYGQGLGYSLELEPEDDLAVKAVCRVHGSCG